MLCCVLCGTWRVVVELNFEQGFFRLFQTYIVPGENAQRDSDGLVWRCTPKQVVHRIDLW